MSTRSMIAIKNEDGTYTGIYCQSDGYISNNGMILNKYYNDRDKVQRLIDLGAISFLGQQPEPDENIKKYGFIMDNKEFHQLSGAEQSRIIENTIGTQAYHRDRGEEFEQTHAKTLHKLVQAAQASWCEYVYAFKPDNKGHYAWYVNGLCITPGAWVSGCADAAIEYDMAAGRWYKLANRVACVED